MMRLRTLLAAAAVSFSLAAPVAQAGTAPPAQFVQPLLMLSYFSPLSGVTLSDAQAAQITQIELAAWSKILPAIRNLVVAHETVIGELVSAAPNLGTIRKQEAKKAGALLAIDLAQLGAWKQIRPLLSADQLAQAKTRHETDVAALIAWYKANFPGQ